MVGSEAGVDAAAAADADVDAAADVAEKVPRVGTVDGSSVWDPCFGTNKLEPDPSGNKHVGPS